MRGKTKPVSLARRLVIDLMHAAEPLVVVRRTMKLERLAQARASMAVRPGWAAIIIKAFAIVAREEPWLRTYYLKWPWPHFYELPKSVAMVAIIRDDIDKEAPVFLKVSAPDEVSLKVVEGCIQHGKTAPLDKVPSIARALRITRMPLPLRRLVWMLGLNVGRQRSNNLGTFSVTSIASLGPETVVARVHGPSLISYGLVKPDHTMELLYHWDHRIYDGILIARVLRRLEEVLNTEIADEILAGAAAK